MNFITTYYNYGVGSGRFGAFRELLTHTKTTNLVLNEEIENFPLMYHCRIITKNEKSKPIDKEVLIKLLKIDLKKRTVSN